MIEHGDWIGTLLILNDGKLVSGSSDKTIKIWDNKYSCIFTLNGHNDRVKALVEIDGMLASSSSDGSIKIWDPVENFVCVNTLIGHYDWIISLVSLKNGKLISGSNDGIIKIWEYSY